MVVKQAKRQRRTLTQLPTPALPPIGHPYMSVISGDYKPSRGSSHAWDLAKPIATQLLVADYAKRDDHENKRSAQARLSALCLYLTWIAEKVPGHLIDDPMDHDEIRRYLATDGMARRASHRSRVALGSTLKSFGPSAEPRNVLGKVSTIAPTDDQLFEKALHVIGNFRNAETRANSRALLLLCRSVGATGHDLRYITGSDVVERAQAGTWVIIGTPGNERAVPVLKRFQKDLEDLALSAGTKPMVSRSGTVPIDSSKPGMVAAVISRELKRSKIPGLIQVVGLRKAWIAEQVASNAPLLTLLQAAGLKSLRSFDDLLAEHAPLPSTNHQHIAYELGGTE